MAKSFFNIWPFITSKNSTFAKVGSTLFCQILNRKPFKRCPRLLKFRQRSENSPNQVTRTVGLLPFYVHYVVSMLSGKFFQKWWAAEWFSMQRSTLFMFHVSWQFSFAWKSVEVRDNLWPLCRSGIIAFKKLCLARLLSFILVIFTSSDKYEYQLKYRWWCPSESN